MAQVEIHNVSVGLWGGGTIAVGTTYALAFKAPSDAVGGGITVLAAGFASPSAVDSGSAPTFELVTLGTNSAVNGTIGTIAAGALTAGTVKAMTITSAFVDADYFVAFKKICTAVNGDQIYLTGYVQYQMGR